MGRTRALIAVGAGAAISLGVAGLVYLQFGRLREHGKSTEEPLNMRNTPHHATDNKQNGDTEEDDEDMNGDKHQDEYGYAGDVIELAEIDGEVLKHYRPLLPGHIDAAQYCEDKDHPHDVLIQYCHNNPDSVPLIDSRLLGKPLGKVVFDDSTAAIVYRGDAAYVLFGAGDKAGRLTTLCNILDNVLQALILLKEHHVTIEFDELVNSIAVNSAGKARVLGLHAMHFEELVFEQPVLSAIGRLAEKYVKDREWASHERDHAAKLVRELREAKTIPAMQKKLAVHTNPGHR